VRFIKSVPVPNLLQGSRTEKMVLSGVAGGHFAPRFPFEVPASAEPLRMRGREPDVSSYGTSHKRMQHSNPTRERGWEGEPASEGGREPASEGGCAVPPPKRNPSLTRRVRIDCASAAFF